MTGPLQSPQSTQCPDGRHTEHVRSADGTQPRGGRAGGDLGAQGLRSWTPTAQKAGRLQEARGSQLMLRCPIGLPLKHTDLIRIGRGRPKKLGYRGPCLGTRRDSTGRPPWQPVLPWLLFLGWSTSFLPGPWSARWATFIFFPALLSTPAHHHHHQAGEINTRSPKDRQDALPCEVGECTRVHST